MADYKNRVEIDSLNIVVTYAFNAGKLTNDECALCKHDLLAPSAEDLAKGNLRILTSIGECGHAFHKTCIDLYYARDNYSCPIDKTPWTLRTVVQNIDHNQSKTKTDIKQ